MMNATFKALSWPSVFLGLFNYIGWLKSVGYMYVNTLYIMGCLFSRRSFILLSYCGLRLLDP